MSIDNRLVIVGGTGRNVGKTEFICRLIKKISSEHAVYAIKVSAIFPDEELYHGNHSVDEPGLHLFEETNRMADKDTSRMLQAGAVRVFYLRTDNTGIKAGFDKFLKHIPENAVVISESNSLGHFVQPGLSIIVKPVNGQIKPRAVPQLECADLIVVSDGVSGFPELQLICFTEAIGWEIQTKS
jgi:hypothetical protein